MAKRKLFRTFSLKKSYLSAVKSGALEGTLNSTRAPLSLDVHYSMGAASATTSASEESADSSALSSALSFAALSSSMLRRAAT